jgi:hypothetical protein
MASNICLLIGMNLNRNMSHKAVGAFRSDRHGVPMMCF